MCRMVCKVRVDLPMPGSPPSSTKLPGTSPPPNTRFSSVSRVSIRGSSCVEMSFSDTARAFAAALERPPKSVWAAVVAAAEALSAAIRISLNVFHLPQLGHLPIHFADSCPHSLHTYAILSFAILPNHSHTKVRIIFIDSKEILNFATTYQLKHEK